MKISSGIGTGARVFDDNAMLGHEDKFESEELLII